MHHVTADGQIVEEAVSHSLLWTSGAVGGASTGDVVLRQDGESRVRQDRPLGESSGRDRDAREGGHHADDVGREPLLGEHLGQAARARLLGAERHHRHPLRRQVAKEPGQPLRVADELLDAPSGDLWRDRRLRGRRHREHRGSGVAQQSIERKVEAELALIVELRAL